MKPEPRHALPFAAALGIVHRALDIVDMVARRLSRRNGVAGGDGVVDGAVLGEQHLLRGRRAVDQRPAQEHAVGEQPVAGPQGVQQHDVVRALADRVVELDVDGDLLVEIAARMRLLHAPHDRGQQQPVVPGRAPGGELGGDALDLAAIFEIVGRRLPVLRDQVHHRRREHLADDVGDMGAAARPRDHEAARLEQLQRVAHDRARDVELARQLALARQPVAGPHDAFEDQHLDLPDDVVGGAGVLDGVKIAFTGSTHIVLQ